MATLRIGDSGGIWPTESQWHLILSRKSLLLPSEQEHCPLRSPLLGAWTFKLFHLMGPAAAENSSASILPMSQGSPIRTPGVEFLYIRMSTYVNRKLLTGNFNQTVEPASAYPTLYHSPPQGRCGLVPLRETCLPVACCFSEIPVCCQMNLSHQHLKSCEGLVWVMAQPHCLIVWIFEYFTYFPIPTRSHV